MPLQYWRYEDRQSNKTRKAMGNGLAKADFVIASVREQIPIEIRFQGLHRILQLPGTHGEQLLKALLTGNSQHAHWASDLCGISSAIDRIIKNLRNL